MPFVKRYKSLIFFVCLVSYLTAQPLLSDAFPRLDTLLTVFLVALLLLTPYSITANKKWLVFAVFAFIVTIPCLVEQGHGNVFLAVLKILGLISYFIVILQGFWHIVRSEDVSTDQIFGSLSGYFMIGIGFCLAYDALQDFGLVKFASPTNKALNIDDLMYYSFTVLATVGFGDVTPVSPLAKRLAGIESATGVLYVAVFIGRLIGLRVGSRKGKS